MHYYVLDRRCPGVVATVIAGKPRHSGGRPEVEPARVAVARQDDTARRPSSSATDVRAELVPVCVEDAAATAAQAAAGAVAPTDFNGMLTAFDAPTAAPTAAPVTEPATESRTRLRFRWSKAFHVSPFMPMGHTYDWIFSIPSETLLVQSRNTEDAHDGRPVFSTQLRLTRVALERQPLALAYLVFIAMPLLTWRIQLAIHVQAVRVWAKGVPLYPHPTGATTGFTRAVEALFTPVMFVAALFASLRAWLSPSAAPRGAAMAT